ncbi:hypothetical protein [Paenibacillus alkalitolerans]|uniref:hypothetical protein n=1 Tax=Paenibacillus alkalitolerans TaxID=2799335 RepID=UPI0018F4C060|nr:hypothetical protein [Paenibacillus alkalitolerans]
MGEKGKTKKMTAFALMLTVPVMMTGCGDTSLEEECDDLSEDLGYCEDGDVDGVKIKSKSKSAMKGFGSGGSSGISSGG